MTPLRVLVVDDTITYRTILKSVCTQLPNVEVAGSATHGVDALEQLKTLQKDAKTKVDVVFLDVEMPKMDGMETLKQIRTLYPDICVIMVSGTNRTSTDITIRALEAGAFDFVSKPESGDMQSSLMKLKEHLMPILQLYALKRHQAVLPKAPVSTVKPAGLSRPAAPATPKGSPATLLPKVDVLVIGVSTGGPVALKQVIPLLPKDLGIPVLVVIHMPPFFTQSLAARLNEASQLTVKEAAEGEAILSNHVYIAPGGVHMVVQKDAQGELTLSMNEDPPEHSCRPAVDVLFRSVANTYGKNVLSIILTGMGNDGALGVQAIKKNPSTYCLSQTEETCVVYGMPRKVDEMNLSDERVPLDQMAERITMLIKRSLLVKH